MHAVNRFLISGVLMLVATSTMISQARADFQVNDPAGVFAQLKARMSAPPKFEQGLVCGDKKTYSASDSHCEYRCSSSFCMARCENALGFEAKFDLHVEDCTADSASIYGDNGISFPVSKADYEADGTWVRSILKGSGRFIQPEGQWKLLDVWSARVSSIEGGKLVGIPNALELRVELSFGTVGTQTEIFSIFLDGDKSGLEQVLAFGNGDVGGGGGSTTFLLRRGVVVKPVGGLFP